MNIIKINEEQHLGKHELNKLLKFIFSDGFIKISKGALRYKGENPKGGICIYSDSSSDSFLVLAGTTPTKLSMKGGYGVDKFARIFGRRDSETPETFTYQDILNVPDDNVVRYVCIKYRNTDVEVGTVSIDSNGILTGIGTKFTEVFRGQPLHSTKIRLISSENVNEYEVLNVVNDTQAVIQGAAFVPESNITYRVVGTFSYGTTIPEQNKYIYQYYDFEVLLRDSLSAVQEGLEYVLASVKSNGFTIEIKDLRLKYSVFQDQISVDGGLSTYNAIEQNMRILNPSEFYVVNIPDGSSLREIENIPKGKIFILEFVNAATLISNANGGNFSLGSSNLPVQSGSYVLIFRDYTDKNRVLAYSNTTDNILEIIENLEIGQLADVNYLYSPEINDILVYNGVFWVNANIFIFIRNFEHVFGKLQTLSYAPVLDPSIYPFDIVNKVVLISENGNSFRVNIPQNEVIFDIRIKRNNGVISAVPTGSVINLVFNYSSGTIPSAIEASDDSNFNEFDKGEILPQVILLQQGEVFTFFKTNTKWECIGFSQNLNYRLRIGLLNLQNLLNSTAEALNQRLLAIESDWTNYSIVSGNVDFPLVGDYVLSNVSRFAFKRFGKILHFSINILIEIQEPSPFVTITLPISLGFSFAPYFDSFFIGVQTFVGTGDSNPVMALIVPSAPTSFSILKNPTGGSSNFTVGSYYFRINGTIRIL